MKHLETNFYKLSIDGDIKELRINDDGYYVFGDNVRYHRWKVEQLLGEELPEGAIIHHVDGNRLNNENCNLVVCPDQAYHMLLHARQDALARGQNLKTESYCGHCHKIKLKEYFNKNKRMWNGYHNICKECCSTYKKEHGLSLRTNRPNNWKDNLNQQYRRLKKNPKRGISWLEEKSRQK